MSSFKVMDSNLPRYPAGRNHHQSPGWTGKSATTWDVLLNPWAVSCISLHMLLHLETAVPRQPWLLESLVFMTARDASEPQNQLSELGHWISLCTQRSSFPESDWFLNGERATPICKQFQKAMLNRQRSVILWLCFFHARMDNLNLLTWWWCPYNWW